MHILTLNHSCIVKKEELDKIIAEESHNKEETYKFQRSFEQGRVETNGIEVSTILPNEYVHSK